MPPLFERIAAPVSSFRLVASHMGERRLGNLAQEICLFAAPIAEARPEAVNRRVMKAHAALRLYQCRA
jgi:hypothetical protein